VKSSPEQIDKAIFDKINLNTLEAMKTAEIINDLNPKKEKVKVIVDCPSVNTKAWQEKLMEFIEHHENLDVSCEHKADANHIEAAAASILAKVQREEEVEKLKKEHGPIGSGYPSDPTTKEFLKEHGKELQNSGIFRKSWATWQKMFPQAKQGQGTLEDF
jgi:ribonuclease HII